MGSLLLGLAVVLCLSFVLAEGSWDSFDEGNGSSVVPEESLDELDVDESESFDDLKLDDLVVDEGDSFEYTQYFYLALGVGVAGLLIVVLFLYLFLRRPKNQWSRKRVSK
ncbi:MAG: hypothetical protein KAR20_08125 [Candidatus Heimdallarchaeota archaeon]|nr:hypothetical protein [Candidatus Heimdallarchaeota archaeon]